jgi:hypothetical protein
MEADDAPLRFVADDMLGKLARWLRILGCDTAYHATISDAELLAVAARETRTLLTRDTSLLKRRAVGPHLLIRFDAPRKQLRQVVEEFGLDTEQLLFSRCLICNDPVVRVDKQKVAGKVPEYTYATQEAFSRCPRCGRIYWAGTHHQRARQWLIDMRGEDAEQPEG